jgi:hypothetical protein
MKCILMLAILILAQTTLAQGVTEAEIRQFFDYYSNSPTKLVEMMVEDFKFKDPTMGFEFGTKADVIKAFSAPSGVSKFKAEPVSIHFISPFVIDIHGVNSGEMKGKPFRTAFSTILIFNRDKKLISWTDHVDPNTFKGNSPINEKNKRFVKDFFKFYAKLNSNGIEKYMDEKVRLVDPTLGLDFKGINTIKEVWKQASEVYSGGKFEIKQMYFITENVIDTHGFIKAKTKKGTKLKVPFSTIFILENGKIKHWVDHVDKEALKQ